MVLLITLVLFTSVSSVNVPPFSSILMAKWVVDSAGA